MQELQNALNGIIALDSEMLKKLKIYAEELLNWNKVHNLSGASGLESVELNIIDSLYPLKFIDDFESCLDVGSGGGFPALPLAIAKPKAQFFLVEPRIKRFAFLQHISAFLGLQNVRVYGVRMQHLPISEIHNIDLITSRAAMSVDEIMHFGAKFLSHDGHYLLFKGSEFKHEVPHFGIEEVFSREHRIYYYKRGRK